MNLRKITLTLAAVAMFSVTDTISAQQQAAAEYTPTVVAGVRKADSWTSGSTQEGIYQLELKTGGKLEMLQAGKSLAPLGGAVYVDGKMDGINYTAVEDYGGMSYIVSHVQYDMETWNNNYIFAVSDLDRNCISSCGLAHDPTTGKNYGIFFNFNLDWQVVDRKFGTIDFTEKKPVREIIDVMYTPMVAIACNNEGVLYGIGQDGFLYNINKATGAVMPVGDTGISITSSLPMSMTFDPKTGKLYWNVVNATQKAAIYEVNTTTGAANKVMDTPDNAVLVNMYIAAPEAEDDAPAAVQNLSAVFEGESTTGHVMFTAPTLTYNGADLSGELTFTVTANGREVAAGKTMPGNDVDVETTVDNGQNEIAVVVSNDKGDSPEAVVSVYAGVETPLAPTNVEFKYNFDTNKVTLFWDAPVEGINGKPVNAADLTYNISLNDGEQIMAENVQGTTTSFEFAPAKLAAYYFTVVAVNKGIAASEAGKSNTAVIGNPKSVPYVQNFNNKDVVLNEFNILDVNNDGKTWDWEKDYNGEGRMYYFVNREHAADDWLLTPPIYLFANAKYELKFEALTAYINCVDYLHVAYGKGFDVDTYDTLFEKIVLDEPQTATFTTDEIVPEKAGAYYFGFHVISQPDNGGNLLIKNMSITLKDGKTAIADNTVAQPTVVATDGAIVIAGAEGQKVNIYAADGRLVEQFDGTTYMQRAMPRGMYIVSIAGNTMRVAVK